MHDRVDGVLQHGRQGVRHAVVHPEPFLATHDEPVPSQVGEVPGGRRLGNVQAAVDVADTDLTLLQKGEDAQAERVRESAARPRDEVDIGDGAGSLTCRSTRRVCHCEFALTNILPGTDTANTFV